MKRITSTLLALALLAPLPSLRAVGPVQPAIDLRESLTPSPVKQMGRGFVEIAGKNLGAPDALVHVRVTTSKGATFQAEVRARNGRFSCRYPQDFAGGPALSPLLLYVDATDAPAFSGEDARAHQAEALLIVAGPTPPDLPQVFADDFIDAAGKKDADCAQFARSRVLTNLFLQSRAAQLMHIQRPGFDLANAADFAWFQEHASLYEFDYRDRDWTQPLGNRVARGFWQAVWNRWFNATNDHPWDGHAENRDPKNYRPYTFTNDPADMVVLYQILRAAQPVVNDHRAGLVREVVENLLAMQHRGADNFALKEASGKQEHYTAGAFRYGMFETGEWLTEGKGWFANPAFRDFENGGVLDGRGVWALGETLKAEPNGPLAAKIRAALPLTLRFCLHEGLAHRYTRLTKRGLPIWGIPGEHGYLALGMLAAAEVAPDLPVTLAPDKPARPLRAHCRDALDALAESAQPDGTWSHYANVDAVNIAALAEGTRVFGGDAAATRWKAAASRAADVWLALQPLPAERTTPTPLFGHRKDAGMTYFLGAEKRARAELYMNGLWLHALANLHRVTRNPRYLQRAHAIAAYYCGANPLHVRLLSELGSVNNRLTDSDADGIEDQLAWDAYPESTAFVQIGLLHLLRQ